MKKTFLIFFILIISLTACKKNTENIQADSLSEEYSMKTTWYYKEEQSDYEKAAPPIEPEGSYGELRDYYEMTNGEIYFLYQEDLTEEENNNYRVNAPRENVEYKHTVIRYMPDENTFSTLALKTDSGTFLSHISVSENGTIILFDTLRAYVYLNGEEESKTDFPSDPRGGVLFLDEWHFICQPAMRSAYMVFDLRTGEKMEDYISKEFLQAGGMNGCTFLAGTLNEEILVTGNGIYEKDGNEWILKISSEKTSMGLASFWPNKVWKEGEDYFIVSENTLYHYFLAERNGEEEEILLTIFSASESAFLKEAALQYQILHPNISISYKFAAHDEPKDRQEIDTLLKQVNAEIVSDQAADIYILDKLPWEDYVEKGILLNVDEAVKPLLGTGAYFDKVLNGYHSENGTFAVPLFFRADCFVCKKEIKPYVQSLMTLAEYLKENPEEEGVTPFSYYNNVNGFFFPMLYHYYGDELYKDGKVTRENLEGFLKNAKIIYDRMGQDKEADYSYYPIKYNEFDNYVLDEMWQLLGCEKGGLSLYVIGDKNVIAVPQIFHYEEYEIFPGGQFHPVMLTGIHSRSKQPEEAEKFLQFLISYTKEYSEKENWACNNIGIPVSRTTPQVWLERWREQNIERFEQGFYYDRNYGEDYPVYLPKEGDGERLIKILEQASMPRGYASSLTDSVYGILVQGAEEYFKGEKTLEKTVDELYNRISIKQSEEE